MVQKLSAKIAVARNWFYADIGRSKEISAPSEYCKELARRYRTVILIKNP